MEANSTSQPPNLALDTDLFSTLPASPGRLTHIREAPNLRNFVAKLCITAILKCCTDPYIENIDLLR